MGNGQAVPLSLYIYAPSKAAPIVFTILYALSAAAHIYQCHRHKSWRLLGLFALCALCFTLGYVLRAYNAFDAYIYSTSNTAILIAYILSQVFVYICPPLLELANYHILGCVLAYVPHCSPLRPKVVLRIFGSIMLVVETLNSCGISLSANPSSEKTTQELGKSMTLAALGMQIFVILTFVALSTVFHRRVRAIGPRIDAVEGALRTLYASMTLIFVRCIYRLVEHVGNTEIDLGNELKLAKLSPILRYEAFFYVFETVLMLLNMVLWNVRNPGDFLGRNVYLGSDGVTEVEYEELHERWRWLVWFSNGSKREGSRFRDRVQLEQISSRSQ